MTETMELIERMNRDLRAAARLLPRERARALVDLYYTIQRLRTRGANQERAAEADEEPNELVSWVHDAMRKIEDNIRKSLGEFAGAYRVGQWMQGLVGIGPVISAGFLAHIDIRMAPTYGHIWRFAGLDPTCVWMPKQKRPWNAKLKVLCWKAGECFTKFCNHPNQFYGTIYAQRKLYESERNDRLCYKEQADLSLASKNFGLDTQARKWYEQGKLPPGRIHLRSQRYAVKMFISHLHSVMYLDFYNRMPPRPYPMEKLSAQHTHLVPVPNWDWDDPWSAYSGKSLTELLTDDNRHEQNGEG